jgi:putative inorganic carbon (hco3(-)) transporter
MTSAITYPGLSVVGQQTVRARSAGLLGALTLGYVALLPYQFETSTGMNFAPSDCFLVLALLLAAGQLKYVKPAWTIWHYAILLTFAAGSLNAALRFGGLSRYELVNKFAGLFLPFLSYAAITTVVTEWEDVRRILRVFIISVAIENVVAVAAFVVAYFTGQTNPFVRYDGLRLSGTLIDPNAHGGILVAAFVMCEGGSWGRRPLFRGLLLWFIRVTLALGILFSFSRSAWIALGMALLVVAMLRIVVALRLVFLFAIGAPCLILLLGPKFVPIFERMARRPDQVRERFDLINIALRAFLEHPVIGGGLGSFRLSAGEVAHNTAMWFLADFGLGGLLVLAGFLGWFLRKSWLAYNLAPVAERPLALALLLAHVAMIGLAMGIEAFYQRHWWLVFALIAACYSLAIRPAGSQRREYRGLHSW